MNILFLFTSVPHLDNTSSIFSSLIHEFKSKGHNIFVSTKGENLKKTQLEIENNIPVLRIKAHDFVGVKSSIKKGLAYQEYTLKQAIYTYRYFKNEKIDYIISHSLPPELPIMMLYLKKKFKAKFYLIQTDFIWQDAVAFNYFSRNGIIARYYKYLERKMFKLADYIACPTQGNIDFIKNFYSNIEDSRFKILPFWQRKIEINNTQSNIINELSLKDKFIVIYGGSVGAAQGIERIIELARSCIEYNDIVFIILGRGTYLGSIKQQVKENRLTNVLFKDFLPQNEYLQFLSCCNVGLIILNEKMATPNFPSKALSYLNMRVPILAALDYITDFGLYLEENNAGLWGYSDNIEELKEKLLIYYNSNEYCDKVRNCGYDLFIKELTPDKAYNRIIQTLENERY